ncbi:GNAT family N-acetyltransferase [Bacillus sp. 1P10SD]|uniref:GNAT family N-acetyltransferase n=1 Tax=Bacillus sp. 1P10SD TaxID=3132265 RepID=UPI0039A6A539
MKVMETERLILRWLTPEDVEFIFGLLNDPTWIRFIGDRNIRTLLDAKNYIITAPMKMYTELGFGLFLTELKDGHIPIGICGLIKREGLEDVDIGFAFLSRYQSKGYAYEAAFATMQYASEELGLRRIVAITSKDNDASSRLLERIGMSFERYITMPNDKEELKLYGYGDSPPVE